MEGFHIKTKRFALQLYTKLNVKVRNQFSVLTTTFAYVDYFELNVLTDRLSPKKIWETWDKKQLGLYKCASRSVC